MISKTLSTSVCYARLFDVLPDLAEFAQSLYPLLVAHADDFGREQGDVLTVKYRIHPRSPRTQDEFEQAMKALHAVGLIAWYERHGRQCYQIAKFDEHQTGLHKRTRSAFPSIPGNSGNAPESPGQLKRRELKRTEQNRTEGTPSVFDSSAPPTGAEPSAAVMVFDTHGTVKSWPLTDAQIADWHDAYPALDIIGEARKAMAWLRADRSRLKTAKGMPRFLVNWLNRATNNGGYQRNGGTAGHEGRQIARGARNADAFDEAYDALEAHREK